MKDEQIKQEALKETALEDEELEGVSGGVRKKLAGSENDLDSECAPNRLSQDL